MVTSTVCSDNAFSPSLRQHPAPDANPAPAAPGSNGSTAAADGSSNSPPGGNLPSFLDQPAPPINAASTCAVQKHERTITQTTHEKLAGNSRKTRLKVRRDRICSPVVGCHLRECSLQCEIMNEAVRHHDVATVACSDVPDHQRNGVVMRALCKCPRLQCSHKQESQRRPIGSPSGTRGQGHVRAMGWSKSGVFPVS